MGVDICFGPYLFVVFDRNKMSSPLAQGYNSVAHGKL
jgi:hypothetical protein